MQATESDNNIINFNAAIPTVSNQTITTDVFRDTYAMLTCPIPLPTVRIAYTIIWEQLVDSSPIPLMNGSESSGYILSQDNRTLSILIPNSTDNRIFQCMVNLQRCLTCRCLVPFNIIGPFMETNVLGKSMIYNLNYT